MIYDRMDSRNSSTLHRRATFFFCQMSFARCVRTCFGFENLVALSCYTTIQPVALFTYSKSDIISVTVVFKIIRS